jgi:hypothetical protein
MSDWIKCSERMPEPGWFVLGYIPSDNVILMVLLDDMGAIPDGPPVWDVSFNNDTHFRLEAVTHWMPIPDPPTD